MNLDHIFINLALSSVNLAVGHVVGIAAVRTDYRGNVLVTNGEKAAFSTKVLLPDTIEAEYSKDDDAALIVPAVEAMRKIIQAPHFDSSYVVVAYGAGVNRSFLAKAWTEAGEEGEVFGVKRSWLDMQQLAWPLAFNDMIPSRDLDSIAKHFGIVNAHPDTCTGDCTVLAQTYWAMMRRYNLAMSGERAVRSAVGEPIADIIGKLGSAIGF